MQPPQKGDKGVLVCNRVKDLLEPLPGASEHWCERCLHKVWIAPSGVELIAAAPDRMSVICIPCFTKDNVLEVDKMGFAPGSLKEMAELGAPLEDERALEELAAGYLLHLKNRGRRRRR